MGSRMELFEQIRRDRDREGLSTRALAVRYGVHRRAVRQALASPLPPAQAARVAAGAEARGVSRADRRWLEADRDAPRKQRHTARRVWQRLVEEHGAQVSERQVSQYVACARRELGDRRRGVRAPASRRRGEAEVDWGEAAVIERGQRRKVFICSSCACAIPGRVRDGVLARDPAGVPRGARRGVRVPRRRVRADPLRQLDLGGHSRS